MDIEKGDLIQLAIQQLESEVASLRKGVESEKKAEQDAPTARDSWSDTTRSQKGGLIEALQKQYNQAHKVLTSLKQLQVKDKQAVSIGALVEIEENKVKSFCLIVAGTTTKLELGDEIVHLISAASPVARALSGHTTGEIVEIKVPAGIWTLKILGVQ